MTENSFHKKIRKRAVLSSLTSEMKIVYSAYQNGQKSKLKFIPYSCSKRTSKFFCIRN